MAAAPPDKDAPPLQARRTESQQIKLGASLGESKNDLDALFKGIHQEYASEEDQLVSSISENVEKLHTDVVDKYNSVVRKLVDEYMNLYGLSRRTLERLKETQRLVDRTRLRDDPAAIAQQMLEGSMVQFRGRRRDVVADGRFTSTIRRSGGFPSGVPSGTYITPSTLYRYMSMVRNKYAVPLNLQNRSDVFVKSDPDFIPSYFNTENGSCVTGGFSPAVLRRAPLHTIYVGEPLQPRSKPVFVEITYLAPDTVRFLEREAEIARLRQLSRLQTADEILKAVAAQSNRLPKTVVGDIIEWLEHRELRAKTEHQVSFKPEVKSEPRDQINLPSGVQRPNPNDYLYMSLFC